MAVPTCDVDLAPDASGARRPGRESGDRLQAAAIAITQGLRYHKNADSSARSRVRGADLYIGSSTASRARRKGWRRPEDRSDNGPCRADRGRNIRSRHQACRANCRKAYSGTERSLQSTTWRQIGSPQRIANGTHAHERPASARRTTLPPWRLQDTSGDEMQSNWSLWEAE